MLHLVFTIANHCTYIILWVMVLFSMYVGKDIRSDIRKSNQISSNQIKSTTYTHTHQMSVIQMERGKVEVYYLLITFPQYHNNVYILTVNINL